MNNLFVTICIIDVFPQPMEGYKLMVNKGLSNHFQVSHSLQLSGMGPGSYHFAATYVGSKQISPNEVCVALVWGICQCIIPPLNT